MWIRRFLFSVVIFLLGYALAFFTSQKILTKKDDKTSFPSKTVPSSLNETPEPKPQNTPTSPLSLEGENEEIDMTVDLTSPSLSLPIYRKQDALRKKLCLVKNPLYQGQNRYNWAKSYMRLRSETATVLEWNTKDDIIWEHFSEEQKTRLMEDLFFCDPLYKQNPALKSIHILSSVDNQVLSSFRVRKEGVQ